jgi:hypothetical protein
MRLPLPNIITPGNPAFAYQNALAQLQRAQGLAQVAQAQGQYAPQQQQGIAAQEQGYGQNALAQGMYAQAQQQGIAAQQQGLGQQQMAAGRVAVPYQNALLATAQLQPAATQANIKLAQATTSQTSNTAQQISPNAAATRYATLVQAYMQSHPTSPMADAVNYANQALHNMATAVTSNLNASVAPSTNPQNYVPPVAGASLPNSPATGSIMYQGRQYPYTQTRIAPNGMTQFMIPSLNSWAY